MFKKYKFILFLISILVSFEGIASSSSLTLKTLSGEIVPLEDYFVGKPVYLKFWATWCKPCMEQMPHFQDAYEQYGDKIQFVAINIDLNDDANAVAEVQQRFSLAMPILTDHTAKVAQHYNFIGTPFHVLIDTNKKVIFQGHDADKALDNTLRLLSHNGKVDDVTLLNESKMHSADVLHIPKKGQKAVLFTAAWCDWYLADTRPKMAAQCIAAQKYVNQLAENGMNVEVKMSQLWTDDSAVVEYSEKFKVTVPISIDYGNDLFIKQGIRSVPTLQFYKDGELIESKQQF